MRRISDKKVKPVSGIDVGIDILNSGDRLLYQHRLMKYSLLRFTGWDNRPADWKVEARKRRALEPINNEPGDEWRD